MNHPKVLLCDEPTSSLDPQTTSGILEVLQHINRSLGVTIVVVTHEMDVVSSLCNNVSIMVDGGLIETLTTAQGSTLSSADISRMAEGHNWAKVGISND
ncbi:Methionine import ATP-binding protein MetN [compost metagenome]